MKRLIIFIIVIIFSIAVYSSGDNLTNETSNITEFNEALENIINITEEFNETDITSEISLIDLSIPQVKLPLDLSKEKPKIEYVPDEVLIKFKKDVSPEKTKDIFKEFELSEISKIKKLEVGRFKIPPQVSVPEMVEKLKKNPFVEFAEPNYIAYASMIPNDPFYSYQWHFDNPTYRGIYMENAWDVTSGSSSVIVAVVDTGVAYEDYSAPAYWHIDIYNAYGGSGKSWWSGVSQAPYSWTALYGSYPRPPGYGNSWKEYLQHSFDLTSASGTVTFSYYYKYDIERGYDYFYVDISNNSGLSWTLLKTYTNAAGPPGGKPVDWTQGSIDLTSYKGKNILLRFRFNSDDSYSDEDGNFNSDGAVYIDEVKLQDSSGTLFYDNMESGAGTWQITQYKKAPDLANTNFINGYDYVNNDSHSNDDNSHGTHVTGTIAQSTNNNLGVAGVAFSSSIMPVKVLNAAGTGSYEMVASGIIYATDNGANIISMSLGGPASTILESAINYSYNKNVTIIAACGNSNVNSCDYPAVYSNVISVGATQYNEIKAPYSSYGSNLDLVAPGGNTGVDLNGDGYGDGVLQQTFGDTPVDFSYWFYQGTSMATPHVSGVATLLLALNSSLTSDQIRNTLQSTAEDLGSAGRDDTFGYGLINASAAVNKVLPTISEEFISITLEGFPIDFSSLDPNIANSSALGNNVSQYKIIVDNTTTVNVDIYQKGDNFSYNENVIAIDNVLYNKENLLTNAVQLKNNYESAFLTNITPGTTSNSYYWINIPATQKAGNYNTTVYIKAVKTGT